MENFLEKLTVRTLHIGIDLALVPNLTEQNRIPQVVLAVAISS